MAAAGPPVRLRNFKGDRCDARGVLAAFEKLLAFNKNKPSCLRHVDRDCSANSGSAGLRVRGRSSSRGAKLEGIWPMGHGLTKLKSHAVDCRCEALTLLSAAGVNRVTLTEYPGRVKNH